MNTVFDYLIYYNDLSFDECEFNDMDNIVFSCLTYLPLNEIIGSEDNGINKLSTLVLNRGEKNDDTPICKLAIKLLEIISKGKRYKDVIFSNYVYILDDITQFSALTIRFKKGNCYVAFKGTDNSLTGWRENLELSYKYPVKAQALAAEYLKNTVKFTDKIVYVGGHSKGGNLAMASVMECNKTIYNKIKFVYNNDGPGFLKKEFDSSKYKLMASKLKMFMPEESVVGILLMNPENCNIVKSNERGPKQHYPTSWNCFGQFLIPGKLSKGSLMIKEQLSDFVNNTDDKSKMVMFDTLFEVLKQSNIKYFYQIKDLKFPQISSMIKEARSIDEESKQMLIDMIKSLIAYREDK